MRWFAIAVFCAAQFANAQDGGNWPRWRGPQDAGSTEAGVYPVKWAAGSNLVWQAALPGKGCSTPIVWERRIFVTAPIEGEDAVLAFDWGGTQLWQTTFGAEHSGKNAHGSGSNPSPATDGTNLFVYYKSGHFASIDFQGKVRWKTDLVERYGRDTLYWDYGTSPVLTAKDVVIARLHHGESYVAAFDKGTGALHWKVARNYETAIEGDHSYATPVVITEQGREALMVFGGEHLTAHDLSDGKLLWSCGEFNPQAKKNWVPVASPVVCGKLAIVPYGRGAQLHGIKLGGSGDVTATHRAWVRQDTGTFVSTPVAYKSRVFLLRDHGPERGTVECIDPADGKTVWRGVFPKSSAEYYASPVIAGGRLYAAREDGAVMVAAIEEKFEFLAENDLGESVIASPVPVGNRLFIRGEKHLFCIGAK